jgi:hypothetical protein
MTTTPLWIYCLPGFVSISFGVIGIWSLINGKTYMKSGKLVTKEKNPFSFWITVTFYIAMSILLLSVVIEHIPTPN